jgi:acyl CoA:acetate/3-ketoacid CoA transferase alpha subunit
MSERVEKIMDLTDELYKQGKLDALEAVSTTLNDFHPSKMITVEQVKRMIDSYVEELDA